MRRTVEFRVRSNVSRRVRRNMSDVGGEFDRLTGVLEVRHASRWPLSGCVGDSRDNSLQEPTASALRSEVYEQSASAWRRLSSKSRWADEKLSHA